MKNIFLAIDLKSSTSGYAASTSPSHRPRNDHPRCHGQFIGGSIDVVIVLSSLRATRLNGLMRMRRARFFFSGSCRTSFRQVADVMRR